MPLYNFNNDEQWLNLTNSVSTSVGYDDGVLSEDSVEEESFSNGLLEYPQYTRPYEFHGASVPDVLISGHHENIEKWRLEKSLEITRQRRPELYEKYISEHK